MSSHTLGPNRNVTTYHSSTKVGLPEDFRPWVKVCKNYVTSGPTIPAPMPPKDMVFPPGGEFYPPGRYSANIDIESNLRTLDHPLDKWCPSTKYIPRQTPICMSLAPLFLTENLS
jgi:hypothetical protein